MSKLNKPQATARPAREPFLYVTRRDQIPLGRAILIRVIAILLALIGLLVCMAGNYATNGLILFFNLFAF